MRKNQRISERIKPELEKLQKQYANDPKTLQAKQMEINKREGYSYFSACIPMILTLVIFFSLFSGMRKISQYMEFSQYMGMYEIYSTETENLTHLNKITGEKLEDWATYDSAEMDALIKEKLTTLREKDSLTDEESALESYLEYIVNGNITFKDFIEENDAQKTAYDAILVGITEFEASHNMQALSSEQQAEYDGLLQNKQDAEERLDFYTLGIERFVALAGEKSQETVVDYYKDHRADFLYIKSLWVADVYHKDALPSFKTFKSNVKKYNSTKNSGVPVQVLGDAMKEETYNNVTAAIRTDKTLYKHNGLYILVALTVILGFLSQFIANIQQKKATAGMAQMGASMKVMMFMMPIILGIFALQYTAAFTVYMVINSLTTIVLNLMTTGIMKLFDRNREQKVTETIVKHGRRDPHEIAAEYSKKSGKNNGKK